MNTNSCTMRVSDIEALVLRKPIKNLHLSVLPPNGNVRVSAPLHLNDDAIRLLLASRIIWIKKQKSKFALQERQTPREYVSGETHYFFGAGYRLEVVYETNPPRVYLLGKNKIILRVRPESDYAKREAVLMDWYRFELKKVVLELLEKWQIIIGVQAKGWGIKRMKTRWGTCNPKAGRIWLNLELAKKPIDSIEYIVVHELLHFIEKKHNEKYQNLLATHLPKWRSIKEDLNRFVLSPERWS